MPQTGRTELKAEFAVGRQEYRVGATMMVIGHDHCPRARHPIVKQAAQIGRSHQGKIARADQNNIGTQLPCPPDSLADCGVQPARVALCENVRSGLPAEREGNLTWADQDRTAQARILLRN